MDIKDAINLLRTVAIEKGIRSLSELPDDVLKTYVDKMFRYPLSIKWVVGQIALGHDINLVIGDLTSSKGDIVKFCFEHIFENFIDQDSKMVLYSLAASETFLTRGVLSHVSNLSSNRLESALRNLTIGSLVIPNQIKTSDSIIETRYVLLYLTRNYIQSKLKSHHEIHRDITGRIEMVQNLVEEAERAGSQYRYSLRDMGAQSEEEKVAATWAITAYHKYQAGDYDGAVDDFHRAIQIAPRFSAIYKNWATMECEASFYERADELMSMAAKLDPNDPKIWFTWGNIEKIRYRYERAYKYLKKALALSPNDTSILGALGEVEKRRGNFESAYSLLKNALNTTENKSSKKHEIICNSCQADNLRRWAEVLSKDRRNNEAMEKLEEAFQLVSKAIQIDPNDLRTRDCYLEVSKDLAFELSRKKDFEGALSFLRRAITEEPTRVKEKKINRLCCFRLAKLLLNAGRSAEAKKYFLLWKRSLFSGSDFNEKYKLFDKLYREFENEFYKKTNHKLFSEFSHKRHTGKLIRVNRGYGFIELEIDKWKTIFIHITSITPMVSNDEFENMQGSKLSFTLVKTEKGMSAEKVHLIK